MIKLLTIEQRTTKNDQLPNTTTENKYTHPAAVNKN
ncbi:hypothetical protein AHMF7616_01935 [Adhaeribacter pallidiroseus]|uniref:Uncharacterized protein n=1 Tax=Adhaeribacter pallidiroseus TaxID=2072847 RepID=A0A369QFX6_9BACT|nr:hypothetical protein AHMF7616_01935 [Adhaeribacter pallidiroseus]